MPTSRPARIVLGTATALVVMASVAFAASTASAAAGPDPQAAIYANSQQVSLSNNQIVYFDGVDGTQSVHVGMGAFPGTTDVAVSPDGRTIYAVVTAFDSTGQPIIALVPITRATGAVGSPLATEPGGGGRVALSRDGTTAYLYSADAIYPITLATGQVGGPFSPGPIEQVAVSPDGTLLYVAVGNDFVALDARTGAVVHQLALGTAADAIRLTSDGRTAYVVAPAAANPAALFKIDLRSFAVIDQVALPGVSRLGLALSPDQRLLYVTGTRGDTLFAIPVRASDLHLGATVLLDAVQAHDGVMDAAFSADGKTLFTYVSDRAGHERLVTIDVASNAVTAAPDVANSFRTTFSPAAVTTPPDQAPVAHFAARVKCAGSATAFDASASTVAAGRIVSYRWDFGDGTTRTTTGPTVSHTYATPGRYAATVTETDSAGTSTTVVFDGQQVLRNGGPSARDQHTITVAACAVPASVTPDGTGSVASSDASTLPRTGTDAPEQLALAMSMVALGLGLRRFSRRRTSDERDF